MKTLLTFAILVAMTTVTNAQGNYAISWSKIAGGGGTSTGGVYSVSGTIGQPDASATAMTGGSFSLTGGFWSLISVVQTPGAPLLSVANPGGTVVVSWLKPAEGFVLDQTTALASSPQSTIWSQVPAATYQTNATHIFITVPKPEGEKFYRIRKP